MTDVVKIAKEHLDALAAEIGTLEDFIRMAENLVKDNRLESKMASVTEGEKATESTNSKLARLYPVFAGINNAINAKAEREDVPVRELTAKERQH
jgi:hypothetical protein